MKKEGERVVNHASGFKSDTVKSFRSDPRVKHCISTRQRPYCIHYIVAVKKKKNRYIPHLASLKPESFCFIVTDNVVSISVVMAFNFRLIFPL